MKNLTITLALLIVALKVSATGEPSTYFNIFVPPNNDPVLRNVCLIVTAIYDNTTFEIIDDNMDGDNDDSKSGTLMAGQSYILYIKDNGINDDAKYASGGVLKQDGDYFIIRSDKLVYASQSTDSDWQHDWVPSVNKSSLGTKFIIYTPKMSSSNRDVNVMAYESNTNVTIRKISKQPTLITGTTHVTMDSINVVAQQTLNPGEDIIYKFSAGRNLLISGETYVIESDKPITVQYGALYGNERDGGGYVPSSSGASSGELFYFAVPYQSGGEQEIRIVSWDDNNQVSLERYSMGSWIAMKSWTINRMRGNDWVGKNNGNVSYPTVFRIKCTQGKKVSVFEANWLETGNPGTSDIATMVSSENGTSSGTNFLVYMTPPGNEQNVRNPFTNQLFGQQLTHVYLFAKDTAHVVVKDAFTSGSKINRTYTILPGRYVDCYLTLTEWKSIYNGTGTVAGGPERPYLEITSDNAISVMNTNFNDNWMMYFGSSQEHTINQKSTTTGSLVIPGDTAVVNSTIEVSASSPGTDPVIQVIVGEGLDVVNSTLTNVATGQSYPSDILETPKDTYITFDSIPDLQPSVVYNVETTVIAKPMDNTGNMIPNKSIQSVETTVTAGFYGIVDQSASSVGISDVTADMSNYLFEPFPGTNFNTALTSSWSVAWCDFNKDNHEDLFFTEYNKLNTPYLYKNNGNGTFTQVTNGDLTNTRFTQTSSSWVDMDNDGDQDVLITGVGTNHLFRNDNGIFVSVSSGALTTENGYYHGAVWADYDKDGKLDVFICNYMPTRFNLLFRNLGNMEFEKVDNGSFPMEEGMSTGASWCDYDNDQYPDLFVPNGIANNGNVNNFLYHNERNGTFSKVLNVSIVNDGGNSTASCWGDIDNDGDQDLFVSNASNQNNFLYINDGNGGFVRRTNGIEVNDQGHSHGCAFQDFDNDGDLDLYVSNDKGRKYLYINDGVGNYSKNTDEVVTGLLGNTISNAIADYDHDGRLDIACATHTNQKNMLFHNIGTINNWTSIKLVGSGSNKDAIGAKIRVKSGNKTHCRQHFLQSGFAGQNSSRIHVGIGQATTIDTIFIQWPSGQNQMVTSLPVNQPITIEEPLGGILSGVAYYDRNHNCMQDSTEELLSNIRLYINPGNIQANTNQVGFYSVTIPSGNYQITTNETNWNQQCGIVNAVVGNWGSQNEMNLPLASLTNKGDLEVTMTTLAHRRGFSSEILMVAHNGGSESISSSTLILNLPTGVFFKRSDPVYNASAQQNSYSWNLTDMKPGERRVFHVYDSTGLGNAIGTLLYFSAKIVTVESELSITNNTTQLEDMVVGAIDPNDLLVFPKGEGEGGYILATDTLRYKIRFQNVGNYFANSVKVTNDLPMELDMDFFEFIGASHDCQVSINGRKLILTFDGINLPDSTFDEVGSHGYAEFRTRPLKNIIAGNRISNQASITFDYEEAILTNIVQNTIKGNASDNMLILYPNPTSSGATLILNQNLNSAFENVALESMEVFNMKNQSVFSRNIGSESEFFSTEGFQNGVYMVVVRDENGNQYRTRLVVQNK